MFCQMSTRTLSGMLLSTFEELLSVVVLNGVGERITWREHQLPFPSHSHLELVWKSRQTR